MTQAQVFHAEGNILRELARRRGLNLSLTKHARDEMHRDSLDVQDILRVLRTGAVINSEKDLKYEGEKWTVESRTDDDRIVDVVVTIQEEENGILVITVFEVKS